MTAAELKRKIKKKLEKGLGMRVKHAKVQIFCFSSRISCSLQAFQSKIGHIWPQRPCHLLLLQQWDVSGEVACVWGS